MNQIPNKIKSKVTDKDWSLDFIFESMPCNHTQGAKEYEKVNCDKCKYDKREAWLENFLENQDPNEKIKDQNGQDITLKNIKVVRGAYDDCIGVINEY